MQLQVFQSNATSPAGLSVHRLESDVYTVFNKLIGRLSIDIRVRVNVLAYSDQLYSKHPAYSVAKPTALAFPHHT